MRQFAMQPPIAQSWWALEQLQANTNPARHVPSAPLILDSYLRCYAMALSIFIISRTLPLCGEKNSAISASAYL
jgi:hypothetical protein